MGERAKIIVNEYSALELLKRKDLDLDKFYSSDLKIFINAAKQEIEKLNNIIDKQDRDITTLTKDKIKLKNIINELEKYLIKVIETSSKHEQITCKYVLKYLRELKEGEEWIKNL